MVPQPSMGYKFLHLLKKAQEVFLTLLQNFYLHYLSHRLQAQHQQPRKVKRNQMTRYLYKKPTNISVLQFMLSFDQVGKTDALEPFPKKISFSCSRATSSITKCHQAKEVLKHFESFKYWNVFEAKRNSELSSIDFQLLYFENSYKKATNLV